MNKSNEKLGALQRAVLLIMPRTRCGVWLFVVVQCLVSFFLTSLVFIHYRPNLPVINVIGCVFMLFISRFTLLALASQSLEAMFKGIRKVLIFEVCVLSVAFAFCNCIQICEWLNMDGLDPLSFCLCLWVFIAEYMACLGFFRMVKPQNLSV